MEKKKGRERSTPTAVLLSVRCIYIAQKREIVFLNFIHPLITKNEYRKSFLYIYICYMEGLYLQFIESQCYTM